MLIIFLTIYGNFPQKQAQGINLFFFIPCALYSVIKYSKGGLIDKKSLKPFIVLGIVGVIIGYTVISFVPVNALRKAFAGFLILMGLKDLFSGKAKEQP